jgi:hypothetical protein
MSEFHLLFDGRNGFAERTITADDAEVKPNGAFLFADGDGKVIAIVPPGAPLLVAERLDSETSRRYRLAFEPDTNPGSMAGQVTAMRSNDGVEQFGNALTGWLGSLVHGGLHITRQTGFAMVAEFTTVVELPPMVRDALADFLRGWSIRQTSWPWHAELTEAPKPSPPDQPSA